MKHCDQLLASGHLGNALVYMGFLANSSRVSEEQRDKIAKMMLQVNHIQEQLDAMKVVAVVAK